MATNRKCLFCGKTDLSKEHIFAQWLLKELEIFDRNVSMTHSTAFGFPVSNREHAYSKLVSGLVCTECNNGWMSQLESDCQHHIINLMNANDLNSEFAFLAENHGTVAKWAFKNVILLNQASNYRDLVPDEHYTALYSGEIPKGVFIDLAFCNNDSSLTWIQNPGGIILKDTNIPLNISSERYQITFQIKRLLIKVSYYESENKIFYENEGVIRLWPQFGLCGEPKLFEDIADYHAHGILHEYRDADKSM